MKISRNLVLEGMGNLVFVKGVCVLRRKKGITPRGRSMRECWSRSRRLEDAYV